MDRFAFSISLHGHRWLKSVREKKERKERKERIRRRKKKKDAANHKVVKDCKTDDNLQERRKQQRLQNGGRR